MKTNSFARAKKFCGPARLAALALLGLAAPLVQAQSYAISWSTMDGGGGTSTGGVYAVSGTMGQADAGAMSGGPYAVVGGFWALPIAVPTADGPALRIVPASPGFATVSWLPVTPGFVLQQTATLSPSAWTNAPSGATNPIVVPATLPTRFYRLIKP